MIPQKLTPLHPEFRNYNLAFKSLEFDFRNPERFRSLFGGPVAPYWEFDKVCEAVCGYQEYKVRNPSGMWLTENSDDFKLLGQHDISVVPHEQCTCGFYITDLEQIVSQNYFGPAYSGSSGVPDIFMVPLLVEFGGRIMVHSNGIRAQNFRIIGVVPATTFINKMMFTLYFEKVSYTLTYEKLKELYPFCSREVVLDVQANFQRFLLHHISDKERKTYHEI